MFGHSKLIYEVVTLHGVALQADLGRLHWQSNRLRLQLFEFMITGTIMIVITFKIKVIDYNYF